MIINVASSHRFHLLDLARELSHQGHDVRFYSYVPTKRCVKYGLNGKQCTCLLPFVIPFFVLQKLFPKVSWYRKWRDRTMDFIMGHFMRRCDVYIALGTVYLDSFVRAKSKFGAKTILEWGSKHIDEQQRIMASIHSSLNGEYFNERSRKAYDIVDYIAVASKHVVDSFLKHGYSEVKLLRNPYGVNLSEFYPSAKTEKEYDILMVGGWGLRKGCDLIVEAIRKTNYKFLHVGSFIDYSFPKNDNRFTHYNAVEQEQLVNFYHKAKVFILPSREEGLAMVQAQAVACNLPLIGSKDSGAEDIQQIVENPYYITIIRDFSMEAVIEAINVALKKYDELGDTLYAGDMRTHLTWEAYGKRYSENLKEICNEKK